MTARKPTIIATSIGSRLAGQGAMDWQLSRRPDGTVSEVALPTRFLGS